MTEVQQQSLDIRSLAHDGKVSFSLGTSQENSISFTCDPEEARKIGILFITTAADADKQERADG